MAAGLGFKDFTTGEVLTAADVDGYLMQGIWVFANATARDAAVTSPQEGNSCYLKDTDVIQVYSGSSWVVKSGGSSPLTTKGDLYTYSTTDTRLGVGTNGQLLAANSSTATGLEWQTVSSGGMTLISETVASSNSSISLSSIPGTYKQLMLIWSGLYVDTTATFGIRLNNDSGSTYQTGYINFATSTPSGDYDSFTALSTNLQAITVNSTDATFRHAGKGTLLIDNYASTTKIKRCDLTFHWVNASTGSSNYGQSLSIYNSTSAISSIDIFRQSGTGVLSNLANSSIRLYGIS